MADDPALVPLSVEEITAPEERGASTNGLLLVAIGRARNLRAPLSHQQANDLADAAGAYLALVERIEGDARAADNHATMAKGLGRTGRAKKWMERAYTLRALLTPPKEKT